MKTIDIHIGTSVFSFSAPENWSEVSQEQFESFILHQDSFDEIKDETLFSVLSVPHEVQLFLSEIDKYYLKKCIFFLSKMSLISNWVIKKLVLSDGRVATPPAWDFSNMSWEEFIFADTYASRQELKILASILFRPDIFTADENATRRMPFSVDGTTNRLKLFDGVKEESLMGVYTIFVNARKRLADKYPRLFIENDGEDENANDVDWLKITRELLGDDFVEEKKLLSLPVNSVLTRLERLIKDNHRNI